jgi:hypothetical protein
MFNSARLEKLLIHSYTTPDRSGTPSTFTVMFNPESYSQQYSNVFSGKYQGINTSSKQAHYILSRPQDLSLTLIIDGTGVNADLNGSVSEQIDDFMIMTCYMDGVAHVPRYLKLSWGNLQFDCRLDTVEIKYTLFARDGTPLRAELNTKFIQDITEKKRVRKESKNSPDLTHVRTSVSDDNLPLMVNQIYNNPHFYIQVAAANKLNNFRKIIPGTKLHFPPVK